MHLDDKNRQPIETIINSEGLNCVGVINLKVLNGNIDDLSSQGRMKY